MIARNMQRHRHQEFIRFLNEIEKAVPAGTVIHVVVDNEAAHEDAKVRAWLGAKAPSGLASRPIRILLCDEVDRCPFSAGAEGDPFNLAKKRTVTFWNRKIVLVATPTIRGASRIETAYAEGDQRQFWVPCPACGAHHVLSWSQVRRESAGGHHRPEPLRLGRGERAIAGRPTH